MRSAVTSWRNGDDYMVEWNTIKGDHFFDMAEFYETETTKDSNELHKIIGSPHPMMYSWRLL